jgi:GNAT superfamily N-acetyltransferase
MNFELQNFFSFNEYSLHNAKEEDVNRLVEIINDAYSYQDRARGGTRTNYVHLKSRIAVTDFYTIRYQGIIVGCVYLEAPAASLHFGLLMLIPEHRGKGVATQIMDAIEDLALTSNFNSIELDYMSVAPWLKNYYEHYGFIETGEFEEWGKIRLIRMKKTLN